MTVFFYSQIFTPFMQKHKTGIMVFDLSQMKKMNIDNKE